LIDIIWDNLKTVNGNIRYYSCNQDRPKLGQGKIVKDCTTIICMSSRSEYKLHAICIYRPIFSNVLGVDDRSEFFFNISLDVAMATNLVAKMWQNYLPPALIALSIQNGIGYRYVNVRVNSANDTSISCKNFVNFGPVTPEKTGTFVYFFTTWQKTGIFRQISQDILDRFLQCSHRMKAL